MSLICDLILLDLASDSDYKVQLTNRGFCCLHEKFHRKNAILLSGEQAFMSFTSSWCDRKHAVRVNVFGFSGFFLSFLLVLVSGPSAYL